MVAPFVADAEALREALAKALVEVCTVHLPWAGRPWPGGIDPQVVAWAQRCADDALLASGAIADAVPPTNINIPMDVHHSPDGLGHTTGRAFVDIAVEYDPSLEKRGEYRAPPYGACAIVLREWDEQVFLHELLHVILGCPDPTDEDPYGHRTISRIEVALWETGWRYLAPTGATTQRGAS